MRASIIGRDAELASIATFLDRREGGALLLKGEAGIGKTTLWSAAVSEARDRGVTVLAARVVAPETDLAYTTLADLLEPVDEAVFRGLAEPQRRALEIALLRAEPDSRRLDVRAVAAGTRGILRELTRTGSVLLAIDDVQWLDRSSARVLGFALRRLDEAPVAVIAAQRAGIPSGALDLEQILPNRQTTHLEVGPLSLGALHEVLKEQLGVSLRRRTLVRLEEATGGNPFFALEIGRAIPDDLSPAAPLPVPDNLLELVELRMTQLEAAVRAPLLIAAALSTPTVDVVTEVADAAPATTCDALENAAAAGILELDGAKIHFAHPLYAAAVYASAPLDDRRAVHTRLAGVLDGIEERARHLALAAKDPDEAIAVILDEAAEHARRRGAPDSAAAFAEQARALTPVEHGSRALRRTITAAEFHFHAGELGRARTMLDEVIDSAPEKPIKARALRLLADVIAHQTSIRDAVGVLNDALVLTSDPATRVAIELQLAFNANASGDFIAAAAHATRALELAEPLGPEGGLAEALAVAEMARLQSGRGVNEANLERALALEDPDRLVISELRPSLIAGLIMLYLGRLERSIELLGGLRRRVIERGDESSLPIVSGSLTWASCWAGEIDAGSRYAEEALECATRIDSEPLICWSLGSSAMAAAFAGKVEQSTSHAQSCLEATRRTGFSIAALWASWAIALCALATGDSASAEAALAPFLPPFEANGIADPILGFFVPEAILALIGTGQLDRGAKLLDVFEDTACRLQRHWAITAAGRCRAVLESERGDLAAASKAARSAIELGEGLELRIEQARTLLVAGQIERRRRQKQVAAQLVSRAHAIFEQSGAGLWAEQAGEELARATPRRAAEGHLTEGEQRVAGLAATGLTNREVAAQLFISVKTVEATLYRAYRKLGIRSRAELGALFAAKPTNKA